MTVTIGGLRLSNPVLLAPMAGITIPPLRRLFARLGAGATHTEMISCAGLLAGGDGSKGPATKTERMLSVMEGEAPVVLQLFAGDEETLYRGASLALEVRPGFPALGINMACPMPKVLKKGAGSRLLDRPETAFGMVRRMAGFGMPVWPKIRKSPPSAPLSTEAFCEGLLNAGAALVTVHGRTPAQRYEGEADVSLPVTLARLFPGRICASGDIFSVEQAIEYLDGGCSAVMPARGAIADPFLVPRILARLGCDVVAELLDPSLEMRIEMLTGFGDDVSSEADPRIACLMVKRLLPGMFKGRPGVGALRRAAATVLSWDDLREMIMESEGFFERREFHSGCAE
ncbi:MAG: tRNA-dihydrouridine synthase family protein [Synergistaceae bacterium]|nr:tRNA-dihydrouridine synthase family protein [Synergistota bacterium]NLM70711.1 tRNA-dihydrouridine synthase family protein [Synergistaceae bacterium]